MEETHRGHETARAKTVMDEEMELLRENSFEVAERMLLKMMVAVDDVRNMSEAIKDKGEKTKLQIQQHFQEVKKVLRQREQALLETTEQIVLTKGAALNKQRDKLEHSKTELEAQVRDHTPLYYRLHPPLLLLMSLLQVERLKVILGNHEDVSFLSRKRLIASDVSRVIDRAQLNDRTPVETTKDGPDWHLPPDLLSNATSFGEVFCKPCPSKFTAVGEGLKKAFVGLEARFTVEARDRYGQRSYVSGTKINVTIKGSDELSEIVMQVSEKDKGEYIVTYVPTEIGYHTISITADDKRISSDQFHVVVFKSKDYLALGQPQSVITKQQIRCEPSVSTMRGIATLPNGDIIFTDAFCLRVINPTTGQLIRTIGCYGNGPGEFTLPLGLAVNQQGFIFVSDSTNHRIQKFSSNGRFQLVFGVTGRGGGLNSPEGISLLGEEKVYVADQGNNRIQVFSQKNGRHSTSFGRKGREPGQFIEPRDVAVDSRNHCVLVSDTGNARIQALSLDGKPLLHFGTRGSVRLSFPYFLAVDENGFIVVTETKTQMVTILTPQGSFVRYLGPSVGETPGYFRTPYGVTITSKGLIMVTDSTIPSVLIF